MQFETFEVIGYVLRAWLCDLRLKNEPVVKPAGAAGSNERTMRVLQRTMYCARAQKFYELFLFFLLRSSSLYSLYATCQPKFCFTSVCSIRFKIVNSPNSIGNKRFVSYVLHYVAISIIYRASIEYCIYALGEFQQNRFYKIIFIYSKYTLMLTQLLRCWKPFAVGKTVGMGIH